ncbi:MAG TPA: adenylate/guanylate cyclase domain-containing protein [Hanamia sp.]|nr:adenylate/guanylate cyclase domain-containing protein [Hanamia sp.]
MAKSMLKQIFSRKTNTANLLKDMVKRLGANVCVEDEKGNEIFSYGAPEYGFKKEIFFEEEPIGLIKDNKDAGDWIAEFLVELLQKELERKRLGSEVLNLYQEINLIFNFSDKLAQTIGATDISKIALAEALHVIESDFGVVALWDEEHKIMKVEASEGALFFDEEKINKELPLLRKIVLGGQSEIIGDISTLKEAGIILPQVQSVIFSALRVKHRIMGAIILASNEADKYTAGSLKLLTTLALQSSSAIESSLLYEKNIREANEREEAMRRIFDATEKFVPHEFLRSLGREVITDVKLGDQVEKIVTVLFTDIRNYTSLSEQMTPEETFAFICLFNERMGPIIRGKSGFINQYLGDSIMAIFPENASDALHCAIAMQREVAELNKVLVENNRTPIQIGIGMHTGPLIMGITGDFHRMDACTIADTVNTASRVESLTKHFKASILLSEASLNQIENKKDFHLRNLGLVQLKGKHHSINVHECFSCDEEIELENKLKTLSLFDEGVNLYLNKSFEEANEAFRKVTEIDSEDRTARFFYNISRQMAESDQLENKAGVVEMNEK